MDATFLYEKHFMTIYAQGTTSPVNIIYAEYIALKKIMPIRIGMDFLGMHLLQSHLSFNFPV